MSLKNRVGKLEDTARNLPGPKNLFDLVWAYEDGQPPITVKVTQQVLDDIERFYGPEAEAERARRRGDVQSQD